MWKAGMTEGGMDALIGAGSAEAIALGPETMGASIALMGMIIGVKKLKHHVENKRERKR